MTNLVLPCLFVGTCYWDYTPGIGRPRFGFYTSLPFGSSLAPAGWGELVLELALIMARLLLTIITHCVDDVANLDLRKRWRRLAKHSSSFASYLACL